MLGAEQLGQQQLGRCLNHTDCDVCFPPYKTVPLLSFCLPDPGNALATFRNVATAVGVGVSGIADAAGGGDGVPTADDLEAMRYLIHNAPHLVYEDLSLAWPVVLGCIGSAFAFGLGCAQKLGAKRVII